MYDILDRIDCPADIKGLSVEQLKELCSEIRAYMVDCCSRNPGHLASSLGAVELIVGLHYIYNTPKDRIVFDVGHQAYAHKILTGRREAFKDNRTKEGISGFPKPSESPYDAFGVGHSSTSISAALGFAEAARMRGTDEKAVAFIGDGALTGGMAIEGLNNAGASSADLLVILNDNNQSIDRNLGALHTHLMSITTSATYNKIKDKVWESMGETKHRRKLQAWTKSIKSWAVKESGGDFFESLGFRYFGPIDGNDMESVTEALGKLRDMHGPRILHCITTKGKGYAPAEADPTTWHAPGKFNPATGERVKTKYSADRYQDVFGQTLVDLARSDSRVVGITPAMASGCGMQLLASEMPDRFFDVGIEEEHAVTFSAGLAAGGMKPFCNIYSAFSQRAYDQIIHDVALQGLPVVLCFDRAGVVGEDGPTHHGAFDLAAYRSVPGTTIAAPRNELELRRLMYTALKSGNGPFIIRYPRGTGEGVTWRDTEQSELPVGNGERLIEGSKVAVIGIGPVVNRAVEAAASFPGEVAVYDMRYLKPADQEILEEATSKYDTVITLEDGALKGGLFSEVAEYATMHGHDVEIRPHGLPDSFVPHGPQSWQREMCGLSAESIKAELEKVLKKV